MRAALRLDESALKPRTKEIPMSALTDDELHPREVWRNVRDIPLGTLFRPIFDTNRHPLERRTYRRITDNAFTDTTACVTVDIDFMDRWWAWTHFEEI